MVSKKVALVRDGASVIIASNRVESEMAEFLTKRMDNR
jgi:hypothetical protein